MVIELAIVVSILLLAVGTLFLLWSESKRKSFGSLAVKPVYHDTQERPAAILFARSLPLCGKPDYLIRRGGQIIPVEVKTRSAPHSPFQSHIMQLVAYCLLVEENYQRRPSHGVIKYADREFTIPYSRQHEQALRALVAEMMEYKTSDKELSVNRRTKELCRDCRSELSLS